MVFSGVTAAVAAPAAPESAQAVAAATGFYAVYGSFHPSDGIPGEPARARLEPFISPALDQLLVEGDAAERHFASVTRHMSPPLIEGDLFTSNFEGATAIHVGPCEVVARTAQCPVALGYRGGASEDAKPVNWTDTIHLVRTAAGWRVDDISYGAPWAFANKGRLTTTLQSAIRDGNIATPVGFESKRRRVKVPAKQFPVEKSDAEWRATLSEDQYRVLREHGTEPAGHSPLNAEKRAGMFRCAGCGKELFHSANKFESGSGWPSFTRPRDDAVATSRDASHLMERTEVHCAACGGHLGHVFEDGPQPTGLRYCMNGAALTFDPTKK